MFFKNNIQVIHTQITSSLLPTAALVAITVFAGSAQAQSWTPLSSGQRSHTIEVNANSLFPIPASIMAKGGALRVVMVGGGEGGSVSTSNCDEVAVQGGRGGDGGEVVEVEIPLVAGQCQAGLTILVGNPGRGAYRGGFTATGSTGAGEIGGTSSVACAGVVVAQALGGGRKGGAYAAPRSSKGGRGGVVMSVLEAVTQTKSTTGSDQRGIQVVPGADGQTGLFGYGSGGGGGGVSMTTTGYTPGSTAERTVIRHAPFGKGGYGAGAGAGAGGFAQNTVLAVAETAVQYGAGGGGSAAVCNVAGLSDVSAGSGYSGVVRITWGD